MTRFLITGRQAGKTTAAVQWVNEAPRRRLVVTTAVEADWVTQEFFPREDPRHRESVVVYRELATRLRGSADIGALAVDNLDHMLNQIFGCQVGLVTATGESQRQDGALLKWS